MADNDADHVEFELTDEQKTLMEPMAKKIRDSIPAGRLRRIEAKYVILGQVMAASGLADFHLLDVETGREIQEILTRAAKKRRESLEELP